MPATGNSRRAAKNPASDRTLWTSRLGVWLIHPSFLARLAGGYAAVRFKRAELVDLAAPRRAAARFLAKETLYRPDDGHYQFKYLPAFAPLMVPFTLGAQRGRQSSRGSH